MYKLPLTDLNSTSFLVPNNTCYKRMMYTMRAATTVYHVVHLLYSLCILKFLENRTHFSRVFGRSTGRLRLVLSPPRH